MFGIRMDQAVTRGRSPSKMTAIAAVVAFEKWLSQKSGNDRSMSGKLRTILSAHVHKRLTNAWDWGGVQVNGIASILSGWKEAKAAPDSWVRGCEVFVQYRYEDAKAMIEGNDIEVPDIEKCLFGAGKPGTTAASTSAYLHTLVTRSYTANEEEIKEAEEFVKEVDSAGGIEKYAATIKW